MDKNKHGFNRADIAYIIYDFDGVMTNNKAIVDENGLESVIVNRGDGLAISIIKEWGISQMIISTETNEVVQKRAQKLRIDCLNAVSDKLSTLSEFLRNNSIDPTKVIYIGNDINDLEAMKIVGHPVAPADAADEVKQIASLIVDVNGGDGVIRRLLDYFD
jgi:3-deoxy-D-manno-octulosonate 8-phosphate phosphatase (KDO 8-P phosphatase)